MSSKRSEQGTPKPSVPGSEEWLLGAVREARASMPEIQVSEADLVAFLKSRSGFQRPLKDLRIAELCLVRACAASGDAAIRLFESRYFDQVPAVVSAFARHGLSADDLRQHLREMLFVPTESGLAKVIEFEGRGSLRSWVRAVLMRAALNLTRGRREVSDAAALVDAAALSEDVELGARKRVYAQEFSAAFARACARLAPRDLTMLRQYYLDGLGLEALGRLWNLHVANISRRLAKTRSALAQCTREELKAALQLDDGDVESVLRLIASKLDVRLSLITAAEQSE